MGLCVFRSQVSISLHALESNVERVWCSIGERKKKRVMGDVARVCVFTFLWKPTFPVRRGKGRKCLFSLSILILILKLILLQLFD